MLDLRPRPLSALKSAGYSGNGGRAGGREEGGVGGLGGRGGELGSKSIFFLLGLSFTLRLKCHHHKTHNPLLNV